MDTQIPISTITISTIAVMNSLLTFSLFLQRRKAVKHLHMLLRKKKKKNLEIIYGLRHFLKTPRQIWMKSRHKGWFIHFLIHRDNQDWMESFRMSKETFKYICETLREYLRPRPNPYTKRKSVSVEEQVAICVYYLGCCAELRVIGEIFGYAKSTIWKCIKRVCEVIVEVLMPKWIKMPTEEECEKLSSLFEGKTGIPRINTVIDGSHIPVTPPKDGSSDYVNRKGWPSMNLMAVVDFNYMFRSFNCTSPGACHDAEVLRRSHFFKYHDHIVPQNTESLHGVEIPYLTIGDPAYPLSRWLIKNFTFTAGITKEEDSFNAYLNQGRVKVEMTFGRYKGRWRRLTKKMDVNVAFAPTIIAACCVLHNVVESNNENFSEDWMEFVRSSAAVYPQPDPELVVTGETYRSTTREEKAGEKVRNALLEITKKMPLRTSLNWRARRY